MTPSTSRSPRSSSTCNARRRSHSGRPYRRVDAGLTDAKKGAGPRIRSCQGRHDRSVVSVGQAPSAAQEERSAVGRCESNAAPFRNDARGVSRRPAQRDGKRKIKSEVFDERLSRPRCRTRSALHPVESRLQVQPGWMARGTVWPTQLFEKSACQSTTCSKRRLRSLSRCCASSRHSSEKRSRRRSSRTTASAATSDSRTYRSYERCSEKHERELIFAFVEPHETAGADLDRLSIDYKKILRTRRLRRAQGLLASTRSRGDLFRIPRCAQLTNARGGAPERIRTSDPCLRRAVLYPAELRARVGTIVAVTRRDLPAYLPELAGGRRARARIIAPAWARWPKTGPEIARPIRKLAC